MSDHATMDARDRFRALHREPVAEMTFAEWTERVCWQPELVTARELAGLSDERLTAMAREFESSPRRRRTDPGRFAFPLATLSIAAGALAAMAEMQLRAAEGAGLLAPGLAAVACFIVGFLAICLGVVSRFRLVPLEQAYASLGLLVGVLDERHPWLYRTYLLDRNPAARDYRQETLRERGPLRGIDCLMMREIARADEVLESTRIARVVARELNAPATGSALPNMPDPQTGELPRLASVPVYGDAADALFDPLAGSIRAFGVNPADRRRQG